MSMKKSSFAQRYSIRCGIKSNGCIELVVIQLATNKIQVEEIPLNFEAIPEDESTNVEEQEPQENLTESEDE